MSEQPEIEISKLSSDVRARLAKLELELSEGDITQKGYGKKRQLILAPYIQSQKNGGPKTAAAASPTTRAHRKQQRRLTRNESRYHSEIRQEAVQQALAEWKIDSNTPAKLPVQPLKRRTLQKRANKAELSDSSSDDDSTLDSAASGSEKRKTKESTPVTKARTNGIKKEISQPPRGNSSARDDELRKGNLLDQRRKRNQQQNKRSSVLLDNLAPLPPPPNGLPACEYQNLAKGNGHAIVEKPLPKLPPDLGEDDDEEGGVVVDDEEDAVYINTRIPLIRNRTDGGTSTNDSGIGGSTADGLPQDYANARLPLKPTRVSQKIQQLLQTLQRRVVAFLIYRSIAVHIRSPSPNYLRPATPFPPNSSSTACFFSIIAVLHATNVEKSTAIIQPIERIRNETNSRNKFAI